MALTDCKQDQWLLDNAADMHVSNCLENFLSYADNPSAMTGATSSGMSPGRGITRLHLAHKDGSDGAILTLHDVWYISQSPANLVSQARLNDSGVHYNDETWYLYTKKDHKNIAYVPRTNNNFIFKIQDAPDRIIRRSTETNDHLSPLSKDVILNTTKAVSLSTWHIRLGHLNMTELRKYLKTLSISYVDNVESNSYCHACELGKATKTYNRTPQERETEPFRYIHTDMVGAIKPKGFLDEIYFFTFTCDATRFTHVYTAKRKNEWMSHLQTYYSLVQNKTQKSKPIERIRTDFGTELRSGKVDSWMLNEGITFEPSASHSQEQNGVSERMGRTILDMTRCTIIEGDIPDDLWPEIVLAMVEVKNLRPTNALEGKSPYEALEDKQPRLDHLRVLGSTVYVLIHKEERQGDKSKSAKFTPRAQKGKLVGYDGHTIYRVFLEDSNKIVRVKDLRIHEDVIPKQNTNLPTYEAIMTEEQGGDQTADSHIENQPSQDISTTADSASGCSSDMIQQSPSHQPFNTPPSGKRKRGRPRKVDVNVMITKLQKLEDLMTKSMKDSFSPSNHETDRDAVDPIALLTQNLIDIEASDPATFAFVSSFDVAEPASYEAAMSGSYAAEWSKAAHEKYDSLIANDTWELVKVEDVKPGHIVLSGKWVFRLKRGVEGTIIRFKARWVVKGFLQQYGIDYDQTFAAVIKPMAFRILFAVAAALDLDIDQMDVKTAFLNGIIQELIYVHMPPGFKIPGMVCMLKKALYGLKQSPRLWYERLSGFLLEKLGLKRLHADHGIFVTQDGLKGPIVSSFVDDLNIMAPKGTGLVTRVKDELKTAFSMVDMGPISYYLGLKVERNREKRTLKLSQPTYIDKIVHRFGLGTAKPCNTPMREDYLVPNEKQATEADIKNYQAMVGSIMFAMIESRPDIAFATSLVSRFAKNPSKAHIEAVKMILRYLHTTRTRGITYGGNSDFNITGYSDSDWAGDKDTRKSTSGFVFKLNNGAVSWSSKRQPTVALSSTESEYMGLTQATKEATWLRLLMTELGLIESNDQSGTEIRTAENECAITVNGDNQGSIALANNPVFHARTKHIDIQHHYIRDEITAGRIKLVYVPTTSMIADGLTKPLSHIKFHRFVDQLQLTD